MPIKGTNGAMEKIRIPVLYTLFFSQMLGDVAVFPVLTGTAANVLALVTLLQPFEAVICAQQSHLWLDECGAPERLIGCKLIPVATSDGKLRPDQLESLFMHRGDVHRV